MSASPKHFRTRSSRKPSGTDGNTQREERGREPRFSKWTLVLRSVEDTGRLGRLIGHALSGGEVLGLCGTLGSGKTTLVRGIAEGLEAEPAEVTSPTFVLIHEYHGRLLLAHADLYRLGSETEVLATGLDEHFNETTVAAIEWADKFTGALPADRLDILLEHRTPRTRCMTLRASGSCSDKLLTAIRTQYRDIRSTRARTRKRVESSPSRRTRS